MDVPATVSAESAIVKQNAAFSMIKHNADQQELFARVIEETVQSAPISGTRGSSVNITA